MRRIDVQFAPDLVLARSLGRMLKVFGKTDGQFVTVKEIQFCPQELADFLVKREEVPPQKLFDVAFIFLGIVRAF